MAHQHLRQPDTPLETNPDIPDLDAQPEIQPELPRPQAQDVTEQRDPDPEFRFEVTQFSDFDDDDDDDDTASVTSLKASILDYRRENGRTYHRFSDGHYVLPNDALEQERLDIANHMWTVAWDGKPCLCPAKDGAKRVLDLGTGTGIWALDYADEHPDATVYGVDLSPIQPDYVPPNCHFEVDDLEREWAWSQPFDFVFCRNMIGAFNSWEWIAGQAFENLEPGGYFEIQDNLYPVACDDGTLTEQHALFKWSAILCEAIERIGRSLTIASRFEEIMKNAGFEAVTVNKQKLPASPWPKDPKLREIGSWTQAATLPGVEGIAMALLTRVLGWKPAEVLVFCAHVRKDLKNPEIHAYWDTYSVYGRKPLPKQQGSQAPSPRGEGSKEKRSREESPQEDMPRKEPREESPGREDSA
ncbi:methyltransferase domain-containing protein [Colletotrichum karsti]|uniref:Methyltransferase domain-containing protein n=1 Tax=Colletotrichum karsti TaxID=1095194 RepID=A0A9P6HZZ0_9PEZI|nr:methyltransferase domain-containing protein [Colletotrichum karsti]KAF9873549.1 methyltransferase domain-containing protein [Colletotrichum karsti]